jgi:hypothetical protein
MPEIEYNAIRISYQSPCGIYFDGEVTGRIHDGILPKYREIDPIKLVDKFDKEKIRAMKNLAERQLNVIAQQDTEEVRQSLRNTIDLTRKLLEAHQDEVHRE